MFARAGTGHYLKGAVKQSLASGDVLVLNVDSSARICCTKGAEFAFWGFTLRIDHLFPLFACTEISLLQTVIEAFTGYKFYPASSPLAVECHKLIADIPPQFNLDHRGHLLRLASAILNEEFKTAHAKHVGFVRPEDHLVQVFEELSVDEMLSLSVPELAKRFSCSRRHLNRLFHQYFGFSVASLRMEMRLMKAVSLLRNCDAKIINVAEQCGFNHLGLFNTCFRRRFGTSPGQWRKAIEQQPDIPNKENSAGRDCPLLATGLCPWPTREGTGIRPPFKAFAPGGRQTLRQNGGGKKAPVGRPPVEVEITIAAAQKANRALAFQVRAQQ